MPSFYITTINKIIEFIDAQFRGEDSILKFSIDN